MNIAFYISGNAGRLRKLLNEGRTDVIANTRLIFSDDERNQDLEKTADSLGISYYCLDHAGIERTADKSKNMIMSDEFLSRLREHDVAYCFSFGNHLLVGDLLKEYENKIINFHPSVLPMFPGMMSIDQALAAKSHLMGNTAHFIDAGVDTGPIILQNVVSSTVFEEGGYEAVLDQQLPMVHQIFAWLSQGRITVSDRKVTIKDATYAQPAFFPALEIE